jgi:argininosuccinate synthase
MDERQARWHDYARTVKIGDTFYFFLQHNRKTIRLEAKKFSENALKINVVCPLFTYREYKTPAEILAYLNKVAGENGIGRLDLVENRYVGMKSRGCYETPGGTVMLKAHRAIESITLDREVAHLKDELMPRYASLIYNGYWWSPERKLLQKMIDASQTNVNGEVRLKLYKGNVFVTGRTSDESLFDTSIVTFEDDEGAYNQKDAEEFIKLNALRMRIATKLEQG